VEVGLAQELPLVTTCVGNGTQAHRVVCRVLVMKGAKREKLLQPDMA